MGGKKLLIYCMHPAERWAYFCKKSKKKLRSKWNQPLTEIVTLYPIQIFCYIQRKTLTNKLSTLICILLQKYLLFCPFQGREETSMGIGRGGQGGTAFPGFSYMIPLMCFKVEKGLLVPLLGLGYSIAPPEIFLPNHLGTSAGWTHPRRMQTLRHANTLSSNSRTCVQANNLP